MRAAIAQQVLLAGLHVEQTADGAAVWSVERGGRAGGTPTFATTKIAEILRPRDKAYEPQLALVLSWAEPAPGTRGRDPGAARQSVAFLASSGTCTRRVPADA